MFRIGKLFHLTHVVSDLDAADTWYDEVFAVWRFYRAYMKPAVREASLLTIGDFVMEPVQLARVPGAEQSPIGKFYARFGQRFHSIAWYVESVEETVAALTQHNIRLYDLVGNGVQAPVQTTAVWTHPKDTHALLEFALIGHFSIDARLQPGWSAAFWRDQHPLGIERASHITVLVRDLREAKAVYQDLLGGKLLHEEETPGQKRSAFFAVGADTVIEAAQPLSAASPEGRDLEQAGEGIYAVTFKTQDLQRAADFLQSKQQRIEWQSPDALVLNRDDAFGMVIGFTQRRLPNDLR
ncbi:MAG: VOC family protein [Deltaproteobacteria bacterium]|nr:VOC family protein [Deltaproteobacteria bacterium]